MILICCARSVVTPITRVSNLRPTVHGMDNMSPQEVGARFGAMILGAELSEGPPAPASPLGRIRAWGEQYGTENLTSEHVRAAIEGRPLPPPE
jgi:hypothetical protein